MSVVDFVALEQELCRIQGISTVRIVVDPEGHPLEVHVLASPGKPAKQLARDIESVAMASFGVELDHRIISVVQLEEAATWTADTGPPPARLIVEGVGVASSGGRRYTAEVSLRRGDQLAVASAEGPATSRAVPRLVAQATLAALRQLSPAAETVDLESAAVVQVGERAVATATMVVAAAGEEVLSGSAVVRGAGEQDAVARAVLDATNRRLGTLG